MSTLRRRRAVIVAAVAGLLAIAALAGPWAWVTLASRDRIATVDTAPAAPVALVLGAGLDATGAPTPFLAGRLDVAKRLVDAGKVKAVLVSGDNRQASYDEPTAMRRYLVAHGVPAERVVADYAGLDTYDSCVRAKEIFGVTSMIVVSQGYHLPRAVTICRAIGVDATGVGDELAREYAPDVYAAGERREILADVKAAYDVLSRRRPILGPRETSLDDAIAAASASATP